MFVQYFITCGHEVWNGGDEPSLQTGIGQGLEMKVWNGCGHGPGIFFGTLFDSCPHWGNPKKIRRNHGCYKTIFDSKQNHRHPSAIISRQHIGHGKKTTLCEGGMVNSSVKSKSDSLFMSFMAPILRCLEHGQFSSGHAFI